MPIRQHDLDEMWKLARTLGADFEHEMHALFAPGDRVDYWRVFRFMFEMIAVKIMSGELREWPVSK